MSTLWPIISTAPEELTYEYLDLSSEALGIRPLNPYDRDIVVEGFYGDQARTKRSMQKALEIEVHRLPFAKAEVFERWKQERILLRPCPNYNGSTILYQSFQRPHPITSLVGTQIGPQPTFSESFATTTKGEACYLGRDGKLHKAVENIPRYEPFVGLDGSGNRWPCNGILIEGRRYQYFPRSHPSAGYALWTTKTGSPTINAVNDIASVVEGESYTTRAIMPASSAIHQEIALSGETGPHSFEVWVLGSGTITFDVRDKTTGTVKGSASLVTKYEWTPLRVEDVSKGSSDIYELVITASSVNAYLYLGPQTCRDGQQIARYIHNVNGTNTVQLNNAACEWADPFIIPSQFSVHVLFAMPRTVATDSYNYYVIGQENTSPIRWGLNYFPSTRQFKFQRYDAILVEYVSALTEDQPCLISVVADNTTCRIFENGVLKNSATGLTSTPIHKKGLNLGDPEINKRSVNKPIAFLRVDNSYEYNSYWDDVVESIHPRYTDARMRFWQFFCEGRAFLIDDIDLRIMPGYPTEMEGTVSFQEVRSYPEATIEAQYP